MTKTYQPQVIELGDNIIRILIEDEFFSENEIDDHTPGYKIVYDFLTDKFINGQLNDGVVEIEGDEFEKLLSMINASCVLNSLKKKGLADSYEDDNTEEVFFLTKEGEDFGKCLTSEK